LKRLIICYKNRAAKVLKMTNPRLLAPRKMPDVAGYRNLLTAPLLIAALCAPVAAFGQQPASFQSQQPQKHLSLLGIPSATVAPHGVGFVALSGTTHRQGVGRRDLDGSLSFGFGFGDAENAIGFQATAVITSLTRSFGDSGYFALKASRRLVGGETPTYASVSIDHIAGWGDSRNEKIGGTVALSTFSRLTMGAAQESYPVMFTLGAGTNIRNNGNDPGLFFGAGIGLSPNMATSLSWRGDQANLGASFKFDGLDDLGLTVTLDDISNRRGNRKLNVTVSWLFHDMFGR